ncbi:kinase-like protein, partial [Eremomyces bilateralis CBS 781.70]
MDCMRNDFEEGVLLDGRYRTIAPLNHGSFGMVFKARDTFTGDFVALKCLTKPSAAITCPSAISVDDRSEEQAIHRRIGHHRNIVNLLHSFETTNHTYLVLEYCTNGDLYEAIRVGRGPLETEHVREFMLELIRAVEFMHDKDIYHRDIKPENIFLSQNGSMKLGDFGLATSDSPSFEAAVGSDRYMAPEQYDPSPSGYDPAKADVWAIGICLLNVLFSRNPFATPTISDPLFADFAGDRQNLFDVFPNMSQDTFEVLMHCLALDPARRSLAKVKTALKRVVSFTTENEMFDEFCTDEVTSPVPASANREPLRTPSVTSPQVTNGAFPWAKALAMSPPQPVRRLSAIPDSEYASEDLFGTSQRSGETSEDWFSVKPDSASISSAVDSGLGVSLQSEANAVSIARSRPMRVPISGSLPAPGPNFSSIYGGKGQIFSKSWSDLYDEENDENENNDAIHHQQENQSQ